MKTTKTVQAGSDIVLTKFERPANASKYTALRTGYGTEYYNLYANTKVETPTVSTVTSTTNFTKYYGKISNCGKDENGKYSGGKTGDQTGKEWEIRNWYNGPWTCVLRYPEERTRNLIAELAIEAAQNDLIGYDQSQRNTYWTHLKASNYRPSKITIACEADCSSGVIGNTRAVGYLTNNSKLQNVAATYTGDLKAGFKAAGFTVLTDSKYLTSSDYLLPGDILLREGHHVTTNLGIGKYTAAASETNKTTTVNTVKATSKTKFAVSGTTTPNKTAVCNVKVTDAESLYVRSWAGKENAPIKSPEYILKDKIVALCDSILDSAGKEWYYIKIDNKTYGFASAAYLKKI